MDSPARGRVHSNAKNGIVPLEAKSIMSFLPGHPDMTYLLSIQCYARTKYKFTCVCVSVCVSVTSVNSPTGQTPQRIFTVDSLTDADLFKDVRFGGSR